MIRAAAGIHERDEIVTVGPISEGGMVGKIVILAFARSQRVPYDILRSIYKNAGLTDNHIPRRRAGSDAFRRATSSLKNSKISTKEHGILKVLVRDWKGGRTPRKDITLEKQNSYADRFEYTSPAACLYYEPETEELIWDNRLDTRGEREAHYAVEGLLENIVQEFQARRDLVDGDKIYYSLTDLIESTSPLSLGTGSYLIWKEQDQIVYAIKSIITALNDYDTSSGEETNQSSVNIFTVVNTEEDRKSMSSALDKTISKEVDTALGRMALSMQEPDNLLQCQGDLELQNYERLKKIADEFSLRFKKDMSRVNAKLEMLWEQHEDMMLAVALNRARKKLARTAASSGETS